MLSFWRENLATRVCKDRVFSSVTQITISTGVFYRNLNTLVISIRHSFRKPRSAFFVSKANGHFEPRRQDFRPFQICTQLADCFQNNLLNHNTCKIAFDSKTSGQRCQRKSLKEMDNVWECTLSKNNYSAEFSNTVVPTSC